jgi:hypothetical protein
VNNVEASHCYPDFPGFLAEVARVLRPGGHLLSADFRFEPEFQVWETAIADSTMRIVQTKIINAEVRRGMDMNAPRSQALIVQRLPGFLHALGRDFAGIPGSRAYQALRGGGLSYRSWCFRRE